MATDDSTPRSLNRRELLGGAAALAALHLAAPGGVAARAALGTDEVAHLLPTISHDRLLIKASLREARREAPVLRIGRRAFAGIRTDTAGSFWTFDAAGLEPDQVVVRYFRWLPALGEQAIDRLQPFRVSLFPRGGLG
jgi:hypothetical protein